MDAAPLLFLAAFSACTVEKDCSPLGYWRPLYKIKETLQHPAQKAEEDC
jgi:hypothetical protein